MAQLNDQFYPSGQSPTKLLRGASREGSVTNPNFLLPQLRSSSLSINQANSDNMKPQTPVSNDVFSGAKAGVQNQVNLALPSQNDDQADDTSPYINMGEKETTAVVPSLKTGLNDEAAQMVRGAYDSKALDQLQSKTDQYNQAQEKVANFDPLSQPISKLRKGLGIGAGIITGLTGGGLQGGMRAYNEVAHGPAIHQQEEMAKQAQVAGLEQAGALKNAETVDKFGTTNKDRAKVLNDISDSVQKKNEYATTGMAEAQSKTGLANAQATEIPSKIKENVAHANEMDRGKTVNMEKTPGTVDGKPFMANFHPDTGKYTDPATGNDVTVSFKPKESEESVDKIVHDGYMHNHPGATEEQYATWKAGLTPSATFNVNNPAQSQDQVKYIADQIDNDSTGSMFGELTKGNKKLEGQVRDELTRRDSSMERLNPEIIRMGQMAKELKPDFQRAQDMLKDPELKKEMADLGSRWQEFMAGKYGAGDPKFTKLRPLIGLLNTATVKLHTGSRGSTPMMEKFDNLFNATKMDAPTLASSLDEVSTFLKKYEDTVYKKNASQSQVKLPKKGDIEDGHVFQGGDPSKPENWKKQ